MADADQEMADAYRIAIATADEPGTLRESQRHWFDSLFSRCWQKGTTARQKTDCLAQQYQDRIAKLTRIRDTSLDPCASTASAVKRKICNDPNLRETLDRIVHSVDTLAEESNDPERRRQLYQDQSLWLATLYKYTCNKCIDGIAQQLRLRQVQLDMLINPSILPETFAVDIPPDWWGVDVKTLLPGKDVQLWNIFTGPDRRLLLLVTWQRSVSERGYALLDAVSRKMAFTEKEAYELLHTGGERLSNLRARLNLGSLGFKQGIEIAPDIMLEQYSSNVRDPLALAIEYRLKVPVTSLLDGRYIIARLSRPETFHGGQFGTPTWIAKFDCLYVSQWTRLNDGSVLTVFQDQGLIIRFRPDLTSPFFKGRSDVVVVSQKRLDDLEGNEMDYFEEIQAVLDQTAREQVAAGKPH